MKTKFPSLFRCVSLPMVVSLSLTRVEAATQIWNHAGSSNVWETGGATNWDTGSSWVDGNIAQFNAGADVAITVTGTVMAEQIAFGSGWANNLTLSGGIIDFGATAAIINSSAVGTTGSRQMAITSNLTGSGGLTINAHGDLSASGNSNGAFFQLGGDNTGLTGGISIIGGLVDFATASAFGANTITLSNAGGILNANHGTISLSNNIVVSTGGGTLRNFGSATTTLAGAISGSTFLNRTDGGIYNITGDMSGFNGTFNAQIGTTNFQTGSNTLTGILNVSGGTTSIENTAANTYSAVNLSGGILQVKSNNQALGSATLAVTGNSTFASTSGSTALALANNITISGTNTLTLNSSNAAITLNGSITGTGTNLATTGTGSAILGGAVNMGTGSIQINGANSLGIANGSVVSADQVALTGTTSATTLNISGGSLTTKYLNIGNSSSNSGQVNHTAGTVTVLSGGNGMRIGHWNNNANPGSLYNLSGGILNTSAISVNIGWDGQGDMIVGGGGGPALFQAAGITLDANGNGGGGGAGDMTLTLSANGTVEIGSSGITAAASGDRVILNGGTLKAVNNSSWNSVIHANGTTTSTINTNTFNVTLGNHITGSGTVDLPSVTGSVLFSTAGTQTIDALISGATPISKTGIGTTTLTGAGSTYSGTITINDGRLNLAGSTASNISLNATKTLGGEGSTSGLVSFNSGFLNIDPNTVAKLTVGALNLAGTSPIRFDTVPAVAGGAFNVLTYTGALTGSLGTNLVLENAAKYRNSTLLDTGGVVTLDIQSKNLVWNGSSGGQWDTLISSRWNASEADSFAWGDAVTFNDTGTATTITLSGELQPSSIAVGGTQNYTLNGSSGNFVSGLVGISKSGASTLILNAPNTFSGANTITEGVVQIGDGTNNTASLGTGATSLSSGTSLVYYRNGSYTVPNAVSGTGTLAFRGTGASGQSDYSISGNNSSFSGTLDIRSGARVLVDASADVGTSSIVVNNGGQLHLGAVTLNNTVSLTGNGWTEANGQLGAVRFSGGTLAGSVTLTGNSRLTAWGSDTGTVTGGITDGASSFGITKTGTGTLTITPANTYDGGTTLSFGRVNIRNASSLGTGAVILGDASSSSNAISLYLDTNRVSFSRAVTISSFGSGSATLGSMNSVTGSGDNNQFTSVVLQRDVNFDSNAADRTDYENISGVGSVTVGGSGRTVFITTNTYTGNLTISVGVGGNLQIGTATAGNQNYIPDTANLTVNDTASNTVAEFRLSVGGETIGGLNGNGTIDTNAVNTTLTIGANNLGGTFSGVIQNSASNTVALTKIGTGTQILSGANTTTGTFTVSGGLLRLNHASAISGGLAATGGTAALTVNGGVLGLGAADLLRGLGTGATQVQLTGGASGFSAHGATRTVNFGGAAASVTWGTATFAPSTLVLSHTSADAKLVIANPIDLGTSSRTIQVDNGSASVDAEFSGALSNTGTITKTGLGTLSLSGNNSATGGFTIGAGQLVLDYTTNNTSKLSNTATTGTLSFGSGTTSLDLSGGSHTETVDSTTLSANAFATITRSSGTSTLELGTITVGAGAALNLGAGSIASANNTNTHGILGSWATIGGDWAVNSTNGPNGLITAYTGYTDVVRLTGTKTIASATASNLRIIEGTGSAANITMAASGTTNINTLNMTATGGTATVAIGSGNILRLGTTGGVLAGTGVGRLDITGGTLTAGGNADATAGTITFSGASTNTVSISSVIANNTSGVVSLIKSGTGTLILNAANTFSGGTTINAGRVAISAMGNTGTAGGNVAGFGTGAVTVNSGGTAWIHGSGSSFGTVANNWTLAGGTLHIQDGATTFSGTVAVNAASTIQEFWGDAITFSNVISGSGALSFLNAGSAERPAFNLNGNNTLTGAISAGANLTVKLGHANALGTTAAGTTVVSGGVLDLNGFAVGAEAVTLSGTGISSGGALINSSATAASLSGAITLAANSSVGGSGNTTLSGALGGAGFSLTKVGAGTLILSNNNTYNGTTTVSAGRLTLSGTNASQITVGSTATLGGTGSTTGTLTTSTGSTIALNGSTPSSGFTVSGAVNFAGTTALVFDAVPTAQGLTPHTVVTYGSLPSGISNLTAPAGFRATITDDTTNKKVLLNITTGTRTWNQTAPATWGLQTGSNFAEGDQQFASGDAIVFGDAATNGAVTIAGTLLPNSVTVNNADTAYQFSGAGVIAGTATFTKNGTGTASVATNNTYTGLTAINNGTLNIQHANALGTTAAGTAIASGATLEIQGGISSPEAITAAGSGVSGNGAIRNVTGTNTIAGALTLTNHASVQVSAGELVLSATAGHTGGPFTLTKSGSGNLRMTGNNHSVNFAVNNGILYARGGGFSTAFAPSRTITVDGSGVLDTVTHSLGSEVGGGGAVPLIVLTNGGTWQANNEQYIRSVTMTAGNIAGSGELRTLGSSVFTTNASSSSTSISNPISLYNSLTFTVNDGAATSDVTISGAITNSAAWVKNGLGTMTLSGASTNTFINTFAVNAGVVRIEKNSALGTTAAGTTVASGAALQLANDIAIGAEALGLSGTGVANDGALRNISGTNSYAGTITLAAAARINSDAGSLGLSGAISNGGNLLTVGGAGNTTISGAIGSGAGGLTKDGNGTLILSGENSYSGVTSINGGTLRLNGNHTGTGDFNVASGAILQGTGGIAAAVNVTGILAPGASIESLATGSLSMAAGSSLEVEIQDNTGAGADLLAITGNLNLSGLVDLDLVKLGGYSWSLDDKITLASYTGTWNNGLFTFGGNSVADDSSFVFDGQLWSFNYNDDTPGTNFDTEAVGSFVTMTAIPEPRVALLGGLGMLALLRRRRH